MLRARLLVPLGAPLQLKAGERLPPVQPKPLNICSLAIVAPSLISGLVRVMLCAFAALAPNAVAPNALTPSAAIQTASLVIIIPLLQWPGYFASVPSPQAIAIFEMPGKLPQPPGDDLPGPAQSVMDILKAGSRRAGWRVSPEIIP